MARTKKTEKLPDGLTCQADGRYRIKFSVSDKRTKKRAYRVKTLPEGTSRLQAMLAIEQMRATAAEVAEESDAPQSPTLADFAENWLVRKRGRGVRPSTLALYTTVLAHHVMPDLGHLEIDQITRREMVAWRTRLEQCKDAAPRTVQGWWRLGVQLIRDACIERGVLDPTARLEGPAVTGAPTREQRTLSIVQLQELASAVLDSRAPSSTWPALLLMIYTGCRRGEAIALRWLDVDFDERLITIRRAAHFTLQTGWTTAMPKNGHVRIVGAPARLIELLQKHRRDLIAAQHPGLRDGLVASAPDGGFCSYRSIRQALTRAAARAGIKQKVTPQVLRRSNNTLLLQIVDKTIAQAIIGHAGDAMSEHYLGLRAETIVAAADKTWG